MDPGLGDRQASMVEILDETAMNLSIRSVCLVSAEILGRRDDHGVADSSLQEIPIAGHEDVALRRPDPSEHGAILVIADSLLIRCRGLRSSGHNGELDDGGKELIDHADTRRELPLRNAPNLVEDIVRDDESMVVHDDGVKALRHRTMRP